MTDTQTVDGALRGWDVAFHVHPYTNLAEHAATGPLVITRGDGVYVYDDAGRKYLGAMAGLWSAALGFSEERLAVAAARQLRRLPTYHSFFNRVPDVTVRLARKLVEMTPAALTKVFFASSGSEATDTAIKLVWYYNNARGRPQKKKIISRMHAYHGVTVAAASLTGIPVNHGGFDLPIDRILHVDCPHYYRYGSPGETEEAFATRLAESLEQRIHQEGAETVAAFIAEPVMAAGGVIPPPPTYFEKIQSVLKTYDILFIVDEVVCGFGRTGNMFGSETYGLEPDLMVLAKNLSAGYQPISALLMTEEIYRALVDQSGRYGMLGHGYTYSGHPVAAAVALEALTIYEERRVVDHVRAVAPRFEHRLAQTLAHPLVGEARGRALIGAVELVADKMTKAPFAPELKVGAYAYARGLEQGLIIRPRGDTLTLCPPLIVTEEQIDELFDKLVAVLEDTLEHVGRSGEPAALRSQASVT